MKKKPTERKITAALVQTLEGRITRMNRSLHIADEQISALKEQCVMLSKRVAGQAADWDGQRSVISAQEQTIRKLKLEIAELNTSADTAAAADERTIQGLGKQLAEVHDQLKSVRIALEQCKAEAEELRKSNRQLSANNLSLIERIRHAPCPLPGTNDIRQARELLTAMGFESMDQNCDYMRAPFGIKVGIKVEPNLYGCTVVQRIYEAGLADGKSQVANELKQLFQIK